MASSKTIPEPNAEGYYSALLDADYEELMIKKIQRAAPRLINSTNAGDLLLLIWNQAGQTGLPSRPSYLSTLDQCNSYIRQHPDLVPLLDVVHKKKAYAWFCESFTPTTPPNHPDSLPAHGTPISEDALIKESIARYLPDLQAAIETYLSSDVQLPHWEPRWGPDAMRSHIAGLKIPIISTSSQSPSLLLHKLGQPSHDQRLVERVARLFGPGFHQRFLCNTSGSGKTRLLLEGLWRNWGLYFTARTQPEGVGSSDLENILQRLEQPPRLMTLTSENGVKALVANREVTSRHFLLVLYVRVIVLRVFLKCASAMVGGITEKHKNRWLLIQIAPETLLARSDIFTELTTLLRTASLVYLETSVRLEMLEVRKLLGPQPLPLFCVLDEAQVPTNKFSDCFLSDTEPTKPRPILRQIIFAWKPIFPNLIVSGTGVSMQELETVLGSVVAKEGGGPRPETVTDLGAFDNEKDQRAYLEQYLPPGFLDTASGKVVASRVGYWLHGRHRFTATYLSRLIQTGFESPHHVLNDFVFGMTNFQPSDWENDEPSPSPSPSPSLQGMLEKLEKPGGFDFSKLKQDEALLRQIAGVVFDYIFNGKPRDMGGPNCDRLVEYGVARFGNLKDIIADEPLALLAAVHYFTAETSWSLRYFMVNGLSNSNESARGIAFEHFGAYLLGLAFRSPRPLSSVFDLVGCSDLAGEVAELVAVHKTSEGFQCNPVNIDSDTLPTYTLGRTPSSEMETLQWLKDPQRNVFCFPATTLGPDLILLLRKKSDHSLIRVLVQFKNVIGRTIGPVGTEDALRTTDPLQFLSRRSETSSRSKPGLLPGRRMTKSVDSSSTRAYVRNPESSQSLRDALYDLGQVPNTTDAPSILRVLIGYPATPDLATLSRLAGESDHPVATVDMASLVTHPSEEQMLRSLELKVAAAAVQRKRKCEDQENYYRKRQNLS